MNARSRTLARFARPLAIASAVVVLGAAPAAATESTGDVSENGKLTIPDSSHDRAGLFFIGFAGLAGLAALGNAAKQLKCERPQADGKIRWR